MSLFFFRVRHAPGLPDIGHEIHDVFRVVEAHPGRIARTDRLFHVFDFIKQGIGRVAGFDGLRKPVFGVGDLRFHAAGVFHHGDVSLVENDRPAFGLLGVKRKQNRGHLLFRILQKDARLFIHTGLRELHL